MTTRRATIVGSGPNGLAAAVTLARAGFETTVLESYSAYGGGIRSAELTAPGFTHDVCSAVHPFALASPFLQAFGMRERTPWIIPEISYAHPLDEGDAAIAWRDIEHTAAELGRDAGGWLALLRPIAKRMDDVVDFTTSPLAHAAPNALIASRFALRTLVTGTPLGDATLRSERARALLSGVTAHANAPLRTLAAAATGMLLAAQAHADGWGFPIGGAQAIANALAADLADHGGRIMTDTRVDDLSALDWGDASAGDVLLLDTTPALALTARDVPAPWGRAIGRYRPGPGAAKVDFALDGPVPWTNPTVRLSPTVHVGGSRDEVAASEFAVARGRVSDRPYVLVTQPSIYDDSRAPSGKHTLWAYIHVPPHSPLDATALITAQIERFAPGFSQRILASHATTARGLAAYNPAAIGGDFAGGAVTLRQLIARPVFSPSPWRTPMPGIYLASASTPPGPGVHGLGGWSAARTAIADVTGEAVELHDLFSDR